jgi:hypothetical protein
MDWIKIGLGVVILVILNGSFGDIEIWSRMCAQRVRRAAWNWVGSEQGLSGKNDQLCYQLAWATMGARRGQEAALPIEHFGCSTRPDTF